VNKKTQAKTSKPTKKPTKKKKRPVSPQPGGSSFAYYLIIGLVSLGYAGYMHYNGPKVGNNTQQSVSRQQVMEISKKSTTQKIADELVIWIAENSSLPLPNIQPNIRIVTEEFMNQQIPPPQPGNVNLGAYNHVEDYIMLLSDVSNDHEEIANLVHELVHFMQHKDPNRPYKYVSCPNSAEPQAYRIEAKWRTKKGVYIDWSDEEVERIAKCWKPT
jgi:hypothetical protein